MLVTWEVKSSWVGGANTCPGRVICFMGMILHQLGGKWVRSVFGGGQVSQLNADRAFFRADYPIKCISNFLPQL